MFSLLKILQNIDSGIGELVTHKNDFIFNGDLVVLNKIFSGLKLDTDKERKRSLKFKPVNCSCGALESKTNEEKEEVLEESMRLLIKNIPDIE
mmetsp:Transcript_16688/g.25734  ORF Transcript_16688/g.25734 Transcript_16688/m.25734 type:complete len:93 (-) Transcript_16688:35-313(-)